MENTSNTNQTSTKDLDTTENSILSSFDTIGEQVNTKKSSKSKKGFFARLTESRNVSVEKSVFLDNLALLVSAGLGMNSSMRTLAQNTQNKSLKKVLFKILQDIEVGETLSSSMLKHNFLPEFLVSLIQIGEESGNLADKLRKTVLSLEKERRRKSQLRSALFYPFFVLSLTVIVGVGVSVFVLPRLGDVFQNLNVELPFITRVMISIGNFLGEYWFIVVPTVILTIFAIIFFLFLFKPTKKSGQWLLFHFPVFHNLIVYTEVSRFAYNLAMLLNSGIPITQALESIADIFDYYMYRNYTKKLALEIKEGKNFKGAFEKNLKETNAIFPYTVQDIITSGEESGKLSEVLDKIGTKFEEGSEQISKNIAVLLEPILLVIVWLGVLFLAVSVLLPIYNLVGNFQV